jgi:hypothetical protein
MEPVEKKEYVKSPLNTALVIPCYNEEQRLNVEAFLNELTSNPN